jgi:hypothetical protein
MTAIGKATEPSDWRVLARTRPVASQLATFGPVLPQLTPIRSFTTGRFWPIRRRASIPRAMICLSRDRMPDGDERSFRVGSSAARQGPRRFFDQR